MTARAVDGTGSVLNVCLTFHLGQHHMAKARTGLPDQCVDVSLETGVIHRMDPHSDPSLDRRTVRQVCKHSGVRGLLPHRSSILAIQCDVEDAGAEFL